METLKLKGATPPPVPPRPLPLCRRGEPDPPLGGWGGRGGAIGAAALQHGGQQEVDSLAQRLTDDLAWTLIAQSSEHTQM